MTEKNALMDLPPPIRKVVEQARSGKPRSAYLFHGESLLVSAAAHAVIDALVPPERRSMNLETYDGRATPLVTILDSARMPGFFGGAKLIWVREPSIFAPSERRADAVKTIVDSIKEGEMEKIAGRFLGLLATAGWSQEEFDTKRVSDMSKKDLAAAFGEAVPGEALGSFDQLQDWARGRGMKLAAAADASEELLGLIDKGLPPGVVLLFTAASVDSRKRVVKRLGEIGEVVELAVERERSGALKAESAVAIVDRVTAAHGKRLLPAARAKLLQRAGGDAAALANEVEKLCLYAGDAEVIQPADVEAVVRDLGDAWIFDFTDALANRDLKRALPLLRELLEGGDHPLRILATLHSHVRLLLVLRECLDGPWRKLWRPGARQETFKETLLPALTDEERAFLKDIHPYRLVLNTGHAAKMRSSNLRRALSRLAELDLKFKSSKGDPPILLEALVIDLCA